MIAGDNTTPAQISTQPLIGAVSSGPDKVFQTGCPTFSGGIMNLVKASGSDDLVQEFTYDGASAAANGFWSINASDQTKAELKNAAGSAVNVSINRDTGVGDFLGVTTDVLTAKTSKISVGGGLKLDNATNVTVCTAADAGVMRYNTATKKLPGTRAVAALMSAATHTSLAAKPLPRT
jgi:pantoate kinase